MAYTNPITETAREIYAATILTELPKLVAPIKGFTTDFSAAAAEPGETITADFAVASDLYEAFPGYTKFAEGLKQAKVDMNIDLSAGCKVTESGMLKNGAAHLQECARLNAAKVINGFIAKITEAAMGTKATQSLTVGATFDVAALQALYAKLIACDIDPTQATLALCAPDYAALIGALPYNVIGAAQGIENGTVTKAFGMNIVCVPTVAANGFASAPTGVMVAARAIPMVGEVEGGFHREIVTEPVTGLTLSLTQSRDLDTGALNFSARLIGGVEIGNPKAIVKITRG